ncbi:hypothetical protein NC653_006215 [Populus alba x Populus x berolinensis]|nr:hypothetical protein NC653_006215 [Populus alba x Populus x berolinensis]
MANRELKNRLGSILNQSHVLWRENDRLMLESIALNARLSDLCYVFAAMQKSQQQCSLL